MNAFGRVLLCLFLAACSGGGSGDPPRITIVPSATTLYSGLPATLQISGGTAPYSVSSSNPALIPGGSSGPQFAILPAVVSADTSVALTVTDSSSTPPASVTFTVRPNVVSIGAELSSGCAPAICAGSDATVTATLSEGLVPLPNRAVQFSTESGPLLVSSADGVTDAAGRAVAHLQAPSNALAQSARLRVTDTLSGSFGSIVLRISASAPSSGALPLLVAPDTLAFSGPSDTTCSSGQSAQVAVLGGTPPYAVLPLQGIVVTPTTLGASGAQFSARTTGACVSGSISVVDATGSAASVSVSNVPGIPRNPGPPALSVQPAAVELANCANTATIFFAGGTGAYTVSSTNSAVVVNAINNTATLSLDPESAYPPIVDVIVQSGAASRTVTVTIAPPHCP